MSRYFSGIFNARVRLILTGSLPGRIQWACYVHYMSFPSPGGEVTFVWTLWMLFSKLECEVTGVSLGVVTHTIKYLLDDGMAQVTAKNS